MSFDSSKGRSVIWTDGETSRDLIWRAYIGFKENLEKYIMYKKAFGVHHNVFAGGLWRYTISFYEEIRPFLFKFSTPENLLVIDDIIDNNLLFKDKNLTIIIRFFNDFLFKSGMKNIIFVKDERDGMSKITQDYYRIKA